MTIWRRTCLAAAASAAVPAKVRFGVTDWDLQRTGNPESIALARESGFEGIQLALDREKGIERLAHAGEGLVERYLAESARRKLPVVSTSLPGLRADPKQSGSLGEKWVASGIDITQRLKAGVLLIPLFFGDTPFETTSAYAADLLREMVPEARRAGVVLGLEAWLSAADCTRILDRIASPSVRMYYDVGISTRLGFDVPAELRWLGKDRIAQIHLKDDVRFFGEGKVDFRPVLRAIVETGYQGCAVIEKSGAAKTTTPVDDARRNLEYIRGLAGPL